MPAGHDPSADTDLTLPSHARDNAIAEVLRLVRHMDAKVEAQSRQIAEINQRLERGSATIEEAGETAKDLLSLEKRFIVLDTRFAIIWAGLGIACASGIGGLVCGIISLMRAVP